MLTIILFTQNQGETLSQILSDLDKIDNKIPIKIWIVNWGKPEKPIKKILSANKNKELKFFKCNLKSFGKRYIKYLEKVKTKYVLHVGDDDRINYKNFSVLEKIITKNYSGITISNSTFIDRVNFKRNHTHKITNFEIEKHIHLTGFISSQIINVQILQNALFFKKKFRITMYPQLFLIFFLIIKKGNWKMLQIDLIKNRIKNLRYLDKDYLLIRLNNEYQGYLIPLQKYISKSSNIYRLCYEKIFFKNILSWINLNIKFNGKRKTYKLVLNNNRLKPFSLNVIFINFLIIIIPNKFLNLIKNIIK